MRFKYWLFSFIFVVVVVLEGRGQEKIDILAEKNEIPYEKEEKIKKSSGKPTVIIRLPQFDSKITTEKIKETTKTIESSTQKMGESTKKIEEITEKVQDKGRKIEDKVPLNHNMNHFIEKELPPVMCPPKEAPKPLFSLPCFANNGCGFLGKDMLCCEGRCLKGIRPLKNDQEHEPIFFGIIERKCPKDPLTELSEVKQCISDDECSPRICCGETLSRGERVRFCRTPIPVWDTLPLPSPVLEPLKTMVAYMQCTPPPPPRLDLYPKPCENWTDCFPNLCCQEKGRKFCRPPRRSLLALVAEVGQRIIPEDAARKFIERIS